MTFPDRSQLPSNLLGFGGSGLGSGLGAGFAACFLAACFLVG
jgi:hypothetical protein